jgi:hypothetical protein
MATKTRKRTMIGLAILTYKPTIKLSTMEINKSLLIQGGLCPICNEGISLDPNRGIASLSITVITTGQVLGILCVGCSGAVEDNADALWRLAKICKEHKDKIKLVH